MSSDGASQQKKRKKIDIDYVRERLTAVLTEKAPAKLPTMKKILIKVAKGSVPFKTLQLEVYKKYKTAIYRYFPCQPTLMAIFLLGSYVPEFAIRLNLVILPNTQYR